MKIGIAGMGRMGSAMAARLLKLEHDVVVWNRTVAKTRPLADAGASIAATPKALAETCDLIITILADTPAVDAAYNGKDGLLAGNVSGKLFIEMSTLPPATQQALAEQARGRGAAFIDCPVGGSVAQANDGKPLGLDPARVMDIFAETSGGPNVIKWRGGVVADALKGKAPDAVSSDIALARKDLRTMVEEAQRLGHAAPVTAQALECYNQAVARGIGPADTAVLVATWVKEGKF